RGSFGLDLATTVDVTLIDNLLVHTASGIKGPLIIKGKRYGALLVGRSSSSLKGLFVFPGIIDTDFTGAINIVVKTDFPPMHNPAGSHIAQLVPLPQYTEPLEPIIMRNQDQQGFGSTGGLIMLTLPMSQHPIITVIIRCRAEEIRVTALLDTGADISIIS
ncbi:POK9 protein, partial [Turnix velox]|nr:POK9 protein [Turnix velox]